MREGAKHDRGRGLSMSDRAKHERELRMTQRGTHETESRANG